LLSALASVGRVYVGPTSGYLVEYAGWPAFYLGTVLVALPGIALLWAMRDTIHRYEAQARAGNEPAAPEGAAAARLR
jgi:PAT family beta-lactamase induction signal transducer AmpG